MTYLVQGSTIVLSGDVGDFGDGLPFFTAADVRAGLAKIGKNKRATIRMNSGGGSATEGAAIASAFASHPGDVTVIVEGVAASAASVAACGADRIEMALGAVWMLHEASALTIGTVEDHEETLDGLEAVNAAMADLYSRKSSIPVESVRAMMAAETWLTADGAVDAGFADAIVGETEPRKPARFDYAARYRHPPVALLDRLPKARAPVQPQPAPPPIADDEPLDPAELADLCAAAEQPQLAAELIRARATLPQARARLDVMAKIRPMMALAAGGPGITATFKAEMLSGRFTVAQVRDRIFDAMAEASEQNPVDNKRPTGNGAPNAQAMSRRSMQRIVAERFGPDALKRKDKST